MQPPPGPTPDASQLTPPIAAITCAVLELELRHFAREFPQLRHIEVLEQGLHNEPDRLRREVQAAVSRVEEGQAVEAIVLGYGLCSRGLEGVRTRRCRLVIPRAHDCITILLGDKQRYAEYVAQHPGTYWYSPGWNQHHLPPGKERYEKYLAQYCEKYGQDNAAYLMEMEQTWFKAYNRATYVDLTVGATEADVQYTRDCAAWLGWGFDRQQGDPRLLRDLLGGRWDDERFLVLEPGETLRMTADAGVMERVLGNGDAVDGRGRAAGEDAPA